MSPTERAAALTITDQLDPADARLVLAMLGLIPSPQPRRRVRHRGSGWDHSPARGAS